MKAVKILLVSSFSLLMMAACNNSTSNSSALNVNDSSSANPTSDAMDYHPDQRQEIPTPDSSNTIGTDTIKSKDTSKKQ